MAMAQCGQHHPSLGERLGEALCLPCACFGVLDGEGSLLPPLMIYLPLSKSLFSCLTPLPSPIPRAGLCACCS